MIALISLGRNITATVCGTITQPLISAVGNGWLYTGVGIIFMANTLLLVLMRKYGERWRQRIDSETGLIRVEAKQNQAGPTLSLSEHHPKHQAYGKGSSD